jgi:hypothetical protein
MNPMGPSASSLSSQVMKTIPFFWYAADARIFGTSAASQSSVCFTALC